MSQTGQTPDAALVQRAAQGDQEAFLALYDRYAPRVYGLALRMLQDVELAQEITQDSFLKLWTRANSFNPSRGSLLGWLLTIARRTALDRIRLEKRRPTTSPIEDEAHPETEWADSRTNTQEARWRSLYFELLHLPAEQRQAVELAYYHGMSHGQIAAYLGIPLGTAKTRIRLGMSKLREAWLAESMGSPEDPREGESTLTLREKQRR